MSGGTSCRGSSAFDFDFLCKGLTGWVKDCFSLKDACFSLASFCCFPTLKKGTPDNDIIDMSASKKSYIILGCDGNDSLVGGSCSDVIIGGAGNDTIVGGPGKDILCGGDGDDLIYIQDDKTCISGGNGYDTVVAKDGKNYTFIGYKNYQFENYYGFSGDTTICAPGKDYIDFSDATVSLSLAGRSGNDKLISGSANDKLLGGAGSDYLSGNAGNDDIYGGAFETNAADGVADTLLGGDGSDRLFVDAYDVAKGGAGYDYATVHGAMGVTWNGYIACSIENFQGSSGNDYVNFSDAPVSSYGVDRLGAEQFGLYLDGRGGNDTLIGGAGNDFLLGSDGNDVLRGNVGSDQLWGSGGNDKYLFSVGDRNDVIKDASGASDEIVFDGAGFTTSGIALFRSGLNLVVGYGADTITIENQFATASLADWNYGAKAVESLTLSALGLHITDVNAVVQQIHAYDSGNAGVSFNSVADVAGNTDALTLIASAWT